MLKFEFLESGVGETIIVTFPDGSVAIVDAYPSAKDSRLALVDYVVGNKVRFVCLTHPHADHALGLVSLLESNIEIECFWHSVSEIGAFFYGLQEVKVWRSEVTDFFLEMTKHNAECLIDVYQNISSRGIVRNSVHAGEEPTEVAGVRIHVLSPEKAILQEFNDYWHRKAQDPKIRSKDVNFLSIVLAFEYSGTVVLLGADALKRNWSTVISRYGKLGLPKASLLKVPHHGASNSFEKANGKSNYLACCRPQANAVLFAGDRKHPSQEVQTALSQRTVLHCLANGGVKKSSSDLGIEIEGAVALDGEPFCQPSLAFEVSQDGDLALLSGHSCSSCPKHSEVVRDMFKF